MTAHYTPAKKRHRRTCGIIMTQRLFSMVVCGQPATTHAFDADTKKGNWLCATHLQIFQEREAVEAAKKVRAKLPNPVLQEVLREARPDPADDLAPDVRAGSPRQI